MNIEAHITLRKSTTKENDIINKWRKEAGDHTRPLESGSDSPVKEKSGLYSVLYKNELIGGFGVLYRKFTKIGEDNFKPFKTPTQGYFLYGAVSNPKYRGKGYFKHRYKVLGDMFPDGYYGNMKDERAEKTKKVFQKCNYTFTQVGDAGIYKAYKWEFKKHKISALWVGDNPLNTIAWMSINSFVQRLKYPYTLYTYNPELEVPEGVTLKDASKILPKSTIWTTKEGYNKGGVSGAFSDEFRFKLLLTKGGIWVDADVICLKYFYLGSGYLFTSQQHFDNPTWAASCFIKIPRRRNRGRDVLRRCIREIGKLDKDKIYHGQIGPDLLEGVTAHMGITKAPYYFVNSVDWEDCPGKLIEPGVELDPRATLLHLNNSRFTFTGVDPDQDYPNSIFQKYKDLYGPGI